MYFWICICLFIPWLILYKSQPHLRNRIVKSGLIATPFGFIDDVWFRVDYWNPPELFTIYPFALEDILFAFLITGITISIYDAFFTKKQIQFYKPRKKIAFAFLPLTLILFAILKITLEINSMYMWSLPMFLIAFIVLIYRKDLFIPSIVTAILMTLIVIPIYMILFNIIAPEFWDTYWFLADTKHGITILGNVALLELLYYFSYGCLAGIMYDFAKGTKKIPKDIFNS